MLISTIEQCGARGIPAAVIISSGFGEEKSEEAARRDAQLRALATRLDMAICGAEFGRPGQPAAPAVATFSPVFHDPSKRCCPKAARRKPIACHASRGLYIFISEPWPAAPAQIHHPGQLGQPDRAGGARLYRGRDRQRRRDIFLVYLEGIRQPARFRQVADKAAALGKPLIVAKVGRSDAGRRAAASHTGALAQSGAIDDAMFRHHGIIRGEDLDHMLDVSAAFAFCKLPKGNRVAIITGSGGSAVWMADILSAHGLEVPEAGKDIQAKIMRCCRPTPRR